MFSGNARVSMDVPPFTLAAERNEVHALNLVGLRRAKIPAAALAELKKLFKMFYLSGLNGTEALKQTSQEGAFRTPEAGSSSSSSVTRPMAFVRRRGKA